MKASVLKSYIREQILSDLSTPSVDEASEEEVEKLEHELSRISAAGGLDGLVPTEGITFIYKGKLYKYTGIFMAIHQIRSMLVYKKK